MFKKTKKIIVAHKEEIIGGAMLVGVVAAYGGVVYYMVKKGNSRYNNVESIVGKEGMKQLSHAADDKGIWIFGDDKDESWMKISEIIKLEKVQEIINK